MRQGSIIIFQINMKHIICIVLLVLLIVGSNQKIHAQTDPVLAGMIVKFTNNATKLYNRQIEVMTTQSGAHIILKREVDNINERLNEFNNYLELFNDIVSYAAQLYGFYYEVSNICQNMKKLTNQIGSAPTNAIAVALHNKRNDIYYDIGNRSVGVIKNIRQICSNNKMTEKERIDLVLSVRPQLQMINGSLSKLTKLVKYTNMSLVWNEIVQNAKPHSDKKAEIANDCLKSWKLNANQVK